MVSTYILNHYDTLVRLSTSPQVSNWTFYSIGIIFLILSIAFFLIPLIARSGAVSGLRIPWILIYVYNKGGFYFATSPILLVVSAVSILVFILRR
jgi:hypothetical protein